MVIQDILIMEGKKSFWCNNAILSGIITFTMAILFSIIDISVGLLIVGLLGLTSCFIFIVSLIKWMHWKKEMVTKAGAHAWMV